MICSNITLQAKLRKKFLILLTNGCPDHIIEKTFVRKLKDFTSPTSHTMKKCPVYLHLPWLGTPSVRHESKIKARVKKCFFAVEQRVIFTSQPLLPAIKKDMWPASLLSNVYNFSCHCDSWYVGNTSQRLQLRICQHVPKFIRTGKIPTPRNISTCFGKSSTPVMFNESTIGQHLLDNPMFAKNYSDRKFTILSFVCFGRRIHQVMQAKFMPPKRICLQLKNLTLISRFYAFLKHPIIFVQLD